MADNEGNRWYRRSKAQHSERMYGIRARLDEPRRDPDDATQQRNGYRPGDYASFEVQLIDPYTTNDMTAAAYSPVVPGEASRDRPVINEERFRVGGRPKDTTYEAIPSIIREYRAANVGAVYGVRDAMANWRWPAEVIPQIVSANGGVTPPPPPQEDDEMKILDLADLVTITVSAHPGPDAATKWTERAHWPTSADDAEVFWTNTTEDTFICYGVSHFLGFEASKIDEQSATPAILPAAGKAGRELPGHIAEKDHPTSGFEASRVVMLPVGIRIPPGAVCRGKFHHENTGAKPDQNPAAANAPHGSITFFCYREA